MTGYLTSGMDKYMFSYWAGIKPLCTVDEKDSSQPLLKVGNGYTYVKYNNSKDVLTGCDRAIRQLINRGLVAISMRLAIG